jgi:hypothetical protein
MWLDLLLILVAVYPLMHTTSISRRTMERSIHAAIR